MPVLKLRGEPVTNLLLFSKYFDPFDLVRQKFLFYDFARGHLCLSPDAKYHTAILHALLTDGTGTGGLCSEINAAQRKKILDKLNGKTYWANLLQLKECGQEVNVSREAASGGEAHTTALYRWCSQNLPEKNRQKLFLFLCACYLLADVTPSTFPVNAEHLLLAAQSDGIQPGKSGGPLSLPQTDERDVCAVSLEPGIYYGTSYRRALKDGQRIRTYRLDNPSPDQKVVLRLDSRSYSIHSRGCLYVNAVDGEIVRVHPEEAVDRGLRLSRSGGQILLWENNTSRVLLSKHNVSSFTFGREKGDLLYVQNYRLCTERCSDQAPFKDIASRRIVEVRFFNGDYFLLQDTGRVYSSNDNWNYRRGVSSLEEIC